MALPHKQRYESNSEANRNSASKIKLFRHELVQKISLADINIATRDREAIRVQDPITTPKVSILEKWKTSQRYLLN
jgi:hypothetical protein